VTLMRGFRQWWHRLTGDDETPLDGDAPAFALSFVAHLGIIVSLGLVSMPAEKPEVTFVVSSAPPEEQTELTIPEEFAFNEQPSDAVGANSVQGESVALSMAPLISDFSSIPSQVTSVPVPSARIEINEILSTATGLHYSENLAVKGAAGEGVTGAVGAIDRITHEILLSLEERKTLIVWLFDQTVSINSQRQAIRERFSKIYDELGIVESTGNDAFAKHENKPLLSAVVGFGGGVTYVTKKPTDSLAELKKAVTEVPLDNSGTENVFGAVFNVATHYAEYRRTASESAEPDRNVMICVFTDEAGSDTQKAEETIRACRRLAMPVYVIGVPATFGRRETRMKYVNPDPKYRQVDQWGIVEQGPESLLPERIKLSFAGAREEEEPLDSGFGPYALTRLCYETGGIYFAVHPNRTVSRTVSRDETAAFSSYVAHFFDPEVMRKYRPDYVSIGEYQKRVKQNKARSALIEAVANSVQLSTILDPKDEQNEAQPRIFIKRDEAGFARALSEAQQEAAALAPKLDTLCQILQQGEADREKETMPRWQAGYDLAMGRALAVKVRMETYNAMLAMAKRGLKTKNPKNNTFRLEPSDSIEAGSQYTKLAERAKMYLTRVTKDHPDTPWAAEAKRELNNKLGWTWVDSYTDLTPKVMPKAKVNNNNVPAPPRNEQKMMLEKKPLAPLPKL
jgi:hypothetical protein